MKATILKLWNGCMMPHTIAARLGIDEEEVLCIVEDPTNYPNSSFFGDGGGGLAPPPLPSCEATT